MAQADWEQRHENDLVPGRWPYGLDGVGRAGISLSQGSVPDRSRVGRAAMEVLERIGVGPIPGPAERSLLTWDENAALRMVGARRGVAHFTGVIWLTDRKQLHPRHRAQLGRCAAFWVLSRAQVEPLRDLFGPSCPPIHFIRFGIDTSFFDPSPYPDRPLVVSVGSDRDRDPQLLFAALEAVHNAEPTAEIIVQSRSEQKPPPVVTVVPYLSHRELRALYQRMTVAVVATRPNLHVSGMTVSLESRSVGRPVVITDSPGTEDYAPEGSGALLVDREPREVADAVIELLRNPDRAAALGTAGREYVLTRHTQEGMTDQLVAMILGA